MGVQLKKISLYAGTSLRNTHCISYKFDNVVINKKNEIAVKDGFIGQSAANLTKGSSETTRENKLALHFKKHTLPNNSNDFAWYLAGLFDGDGWISEPNKQRKIVIAFHIKDVSTAYYIKKQLRFGKVKINENTKSVNLIITNEKLVLCVCNFLIHRVRIFEKTQRISAILSKIHESSQLSLENYYLAGLIDSSGNLYIQILKRKNGKVEIRLRLRIELKEKNKYLLENIQNLIGGSLTFRSVTKSWCYDSVSFKNMGIILEYLNRYQLISKYKEYVYMRKAMFLVNNNEHYENIHLVEHYKKRMSILKR